MSASRALSFAEVPSAVDREFLTTVADILDRLRAQSEMRGHPLLASLLAITKDEAVDDLRTRVSEFDNGGLLNDADDGVIRMAQRFSCGPREKDEAAEFTVSAQLLSFIRA
jgi:hypothetical protein